MSGEDQVVDAAALPKFDMPLYESEMTAKDVKLMAIRHGIPLDLHPVALTKGWTMDQLLDDIIGLYEQYFESSGIRVLFPSVNLFRVFYKVSKKGHWFSFEKRVGKGDGGQVFRETFSGLKERKKRLILTFTSPFAVVTMSEYIRFPFLFEATILKGTALTSQDRVEQHTTCPLSLVKIFQKKQIIRGESRGGLSSCNQKKENVARKDSPAISGATSSPEPLRTINPIDPSRTVVETAESREDHSPRVSPPGSANRSVHNYYDTHVNKETDTLRLWTSGDQSDRAMTNVNTEVDPRTKLGRERVGDAELALALCQAAGLRGRHSPVNPGKVPPL
nr:hypothetical protein [Tanacetum cinerariifolium]